MRPPVFLKLRSPATGGAPLSSWCRSLQVMAPPSSLCGSARAACGIRICASYWIAGAPNWRGEMPFTPVFEYADDTLASALGQSPLSEAEAREVLDAVVDALGYLQAQGLAHPALDPDHVVAVGDRIKLSTDWLREAAADAPYTGELRAFWRQISPSTPARSADILAQALGADPGTGPLPPDPEGTPAPAEIAPAAGVAVRPAEAAAPPKPFPKWLLVGAAGVVLLILGLHLRRAPEAAAQPDPASGSAPMAAAPAGAQDTRPS